MRGRARIPLSRRRLLAGVAAVVALAAGTAGVVAAQGPFFFVSCDPAELSERPLGSTSEVYGSDGSLVATIAPDVQRRAVALERISPWLVRATVAVEDRRFWEHEGVDYRGTVRALLADVREGGVVQGGSTITQQLARALYLQDDRTLSRKLTEGCLAVELDREWSKERILADYLNRVPYGNRAYGAEAAARTYFSKPAAKLGLAEAALLAGLPQAPSAHDPIARPEAARARRAVVLRALRETGAITEAQEAEAARAPLGLKPSPLFGEQRAALAGAVRAQLVEAYGESTVRRGGLRVWTTIDPRLQRLAREAVLATLDRKDDPAGAVVAIAPRTGAIRALVSVVPGDPDAAFNLAAEGRRQAGSTFKTFVLAEAVRRGVDPWKTAYLSAPFEGPPAAEGKPWEVETYDGTYVGKTSIAAATLRSDNTVYARLTLDLGPESVLATARALGIRSELEPVPALGLGSGSVSVLELASAYGTLAALGRRAEPFLIRKVVLADGSVDREHGWGKVEAEQALPPAVAHEVTRVLERNVEAGTGTGAAIGRPAAGKTGTTDDHADAWFAGYTPDLAAAVWVGYPKGEIPMTDVHGIAVAGGTFPATIWQRFVRGALARVEPHGWTAPARTAAFERFCGRFQLARTWKDARPENGCPKPKPKPTPVKAAPTAPGTTAEPPPQPVAETEAPPPPPETDPGLDLAALVGATGLVVTPLLPDGATPGEIELDTDGGRYPAVTEDGSPLGRQEPVEVVDARDGILVVVPLEEP